MSLKELAGVFLRVGNVTFGGGDPTIAALQRELVVRRNWLSADKFGLSYSLARITPGTNMLAFCAASAWCLRGWRGAIAAVLAVTVPSAVLVVWLTHAYEFAKANTLAAGAIAGVLAAAVGMMIAAAWLLVRPHLGSRVWLRTLVLVLGPALLAFKLRVPPVQTLAIAALVGWLWRDPRQS